VAEVSPVSAAAISEDNVDSKRTLPQRVEEVSLRVSHFGALVKMLLRKSDAAGLIGGTIIVVGLSQRRASVGWITLGSAPLSS
jgi:hypothetical protein